MNYEIVKLWDNDSYEYPFIEIKQGYIKEFENDLKEYQKQEEYNFEDYISEVLEKSDYFIRVIYAEYDIFF